MTEARHKEDKTSKSEEPQNEELQNEELQEEELEGASGGKDWINSSWNREYLRKTGE